MFKNNIIEKRVMQTVKNRIATAQKVYNEEIAILDKNHDVHVMGLVEKLEEEKGAVADRLVNDVFTVK